MYICVPSSFRLGMKHARPAEAVRNMSTCACAMCVCVCIVCASVCTCPSHMHTRSCACCWRTEATPVCQKGTLCLPLPRNAQKQAARCVCCDVLVPLPAHRVLCASCVQVSAALDRRCSDIVLSGLVSRMYKQVRACVVCACTGICLCVCVQGVPCARPFTNRLGLEARTFQFFFMLAFVGCWWSGHPVHFMRCPFQNACTRRCWLSARAQAPSAGRRPSTTQSCAMNRCVSLCFQKLLALRYA